MLQLWPRRYQDVLKEFSHSHTRRYRNKYCSKIMWWELYVVNEKINYKQTRRWIYRIVDCVKKNVLECRLLLIVWSLLFLPQCTDSLQSTILQPSINRSIISVLKLNLMSCLLTIQYKTSPTVTIILLSINKTCLDNSYTIPNGHHVLNKNKVMPRVRQMTLMCLGST